MGKQTGMRTILLLTLCLLLAACSPSVEAPGTANVTVYEGARLITGGGGAAIEDSAFAVEGDQFTQVGPRGAVTVPAGAAHVDLTGKTVMPAMVDLHGHLGFQNVAAGTMSKETFTRENLIDHLERLAYHGVSAVVGIGDLVDRSDLHGGRTGWGAVPLRVREEVIPGAALFRTAGPGIAWPGSGPQGHPSRTDVAYPVSTVEEARLAVQDTVKMKPEFIKLWVDNRSGTKQTLTPAIYEAIAEEALKNNVPVAVHNVTLANAKGLLRAGVTGWLHVPVRQGESPDAELIALVKERATSGNRPLWMTPGLTSAWMTQGGPHPDWLDDPLLTETYSPEQVQTLWAESLAKMTPEAFERVREEFAHDGRNAMQLRAAGIRVVLGTDTGQTRFFIGYYAHTGLEAMVAMGMTPAEAIVAATRDSAEIAGFNTGMVAVGRSADFIVLDANPLESISNTRRINRVYLRGQEVPRAAMRAKWQGQFRHTPPPQ
jgi:imidazolonepropionase-like amidohydrolase